MSNADVSIPKNREAIIHYLEVKKEFETARAIAEAVGLPYKAVVDALNSLHNQDRVSRRGRKYSAMWGAAALRQEASSATGWGRLESCWFKKT